MVILPLKVAGIRLHGHLARAVSRLRRQYALLSFVVTK